MEMHVIMWEGWYEYPGMWLTISLLSCFCSQVLFGKGMRQFGKNFFKIKQELLPDKEIVRTTLTNKYL